MNEHEENLQALKKLVCDSSSLEELEDLASRFNIFEALGVVHNELKHSNVLAWLMNPTSSHGLDDIFLKSFLKKVLSENDLPHSDFRPTVFDIDSWNLEDAEIKREWRNIDILIKSGGNKFVCVIENKVHSGEHGNQLARYQDTMKKELEHSKSLMVFLTRDGESPKKEMDYIPIGYKCVADILEQILDHKGDGLVREVKTFIMHYVYIIRRYLLEEENEIKETCNRIYKAHRKALDLVFENKSDELMLVRDCLVEIIEGDQDLQLDDFTKTHIRFIPKELDFIPRCAEQWTDSKRVLLFEFKNYEEGLSLYLILGPTTNSEVRQEIIKVAKANLDVFNRANRNPGKNWFTIYKQEEFLGLADRMDKTPDDLNHELRTQMEKFRQRDLPKIVDELKKLGLKWPGDDELNHSS